MPRNQVAVRIVRLIRRLEGLRVRPNVHLLAEEFHVDKRTIYRDFEALEEAHFPLPPPLREDEWS